MQKTFGISTLLWSLLLVLNTTYPIPPEMRKKGFVYLHEIDPSIKVSVRYHSAENFVGAIVDGYKRDVVILTKPAAEALKKVQAEVRKDGYELVVYDGFRPDKGVKDFMKWAKRVNDQTKKAYYYPRVDKARVFELGYVAERSGHSRGSTVDLTLIKAGKAVQAIKPSQRKLLDNFEITYLDDGTVDMGSSFDLFDKASHYDNDVIAAEFKERRTYLKNMMEKHGFKNYAEEWWHFTLKNEPFSADKDDSYFDFPVE